MEEQFFIQFGYNQKDPFIALASLVIGFLLYLGIYLSPAIKEKLRAKFGSERGLTAWVIMVKMAGFILLGVIPALLITFELDKSLTDYGAGQMTPAAWSWMIVLSLLILILNFFYGRRPKNYNTYPLIREKKWSLGLAFLSLLTSTLFIVSYEFFFRGFLLFSCIPLMGVEVAVMLNVVLYSFAHIHKGMQETIGSVPFGILLCYVTLTTGSFWAIMVTHIVLSLSADIFGFIGNPEMQVIGFGSASKK